MFTLVKYAASLVLVFGVTGCASVSSVSSPVVVASDPASGYHIPKTDCEVRDWYNYQVVAIPAINQRWIKEGLSAQERAKRAFAIRHEARINARYMMPDQTEVKTLQARDQQKYGNSDGPSFNYLLDKLHAKGESDAQAYAEIIQSSSRTDDGYNQACAGK